MLCNSIMQFLRCAARIPAVTPAHVLVYDHALVGWGQRIFGLLVAIFLLKKERGGQLLHNIFDCRFYLTFKFEGNFSNPWKFEVDRASLRSFFWF